MYHNDKINFKNQTPENEAILLLCRSNENKTTRGEKGRGVGEEEVGSIYMYLHFCEPLQYLHQPLLGKIYYTLQTLQEIHVVCFLREKRNPEEKQDPAGE